MAGRENRLDRLSRLNIFSYPKRKARPPSPRERATFLQVIFCSWIHPLLKIGMTRRLTEADLYPTLYEDQSDHIGDRLEVMWGNHLEDCKAKKREPSMVKLLMRLYAKKFLFFGMFSLAEEGIFRMIQVIAIGYVLDYFEGQPLTTVTGTILFGVGGIIIGSASFLISFHWSIFNLHHVCTNIRLGLSSLVYRKLLHLNQASLRASTVGQIVTMIASDLHRFDRKHIQVNYVWISPVHLGIVIYILYFHFEYGLTSLVGLFVLVFLTLIQYLMAKKFLHMRQKRVDSSDMRVRVVVELINAFYTIKVHCWERFFQEKALENRKYELKFVRTTMFLKLLNTAIGFVVTKMSVFLTLLIAFIFEENAGSQNAEVSSKRVFVTLVLYEHVRVNSMVLFPQAINDLAELLCSCRRIQQFLTLQEREVPYQLNAGPSSNVKSKASDRKPGIEVVNFSCRWGTEDSFRLKDINFSVDLGELLVVAGPVASGKSTLICAILGELTPDEGHILVSGRVAYVPQTPILFPGSLRRNIIFGYGYNKKWYNEVVHMCGLDVDFIRLPNGDSSIAEVTQLTISQQAKINLARAVYANADIYLLDDPLHSLDVKHHSLLLETVIRGALSDKAVVLVTHQIHFLEEATQVILINDGEIHTHGTFQELLKSGIEFYCDMAEEDEFYFDEDTSSVEEEPPLLHHDLIPSLLQQKDLRRRGSIQLEMETGFRIRRVSMSPTNPERESLRKNTGTPRSVKQEATARNPGTLTAITMLTADEEAYDVRDNSLGRKKVSFRLYYDFLRTGSSRLWLLFLFLFCCASQVLYTTTDFWIEHWAHQEEQMQRNPSSVPSTYDRSAHISIYSVLVCLIMILSFGRSLLIFKVCINASAAIFVKLLDATLMARMDYFERSCAGHAINRLSKDMVIIDDLIPPTLLEVLGVLFEIFGVQYLLAYANPWFIIPSICFFLAIMVVYKIYHLTAADLKRIEGNARSPVYSHLSRTLQGVTVIRAFGQEQAFSMIFDRLQDNHTASWYLFVACQTWLAVTIDCISTILVACISFSFFYVEDVNPAVVGLSISKMIEMSILVQFCAAEMSNTETQMISVERVLEYAQPQEKEYFEPLTGGIDAPEDWPRSGQIEIRNLHLTPSRTCTHEVMNINVTIEPGQWVGIVGRSGSGKSNLLNSLFRIAEIQAGDIFIDDVDIATLSLQDLRSRISIIPQTPCMFQGTVRQNLDPLNKFTDEEIWAALDECTLHESVQKMEDGLNSTVTEYGINFSAGQRQFICLARVLLEKNKILCCDEPYTSLDGLSQVVMMSKLKEHFRDCTVLMVSHRIHYMVECDRILVLEGGELVEDGTPLDLLSRKTGPFHDLISHLNEAHYKEILEIAKDAKYKKLKRSRSGSLAVPSIPKGKNKSTDGSFSTSAAIHGALTKAAMSKSKERKSFLDPDNPE